MSIMEDEGSGLCAGDGGAEGAGDEEAEVMRDAHESHKVAPSSRRGLARSESLKPRCFLLSKLARKL